MSYFPEPHTNKDKIEVELDLSNYEINSDLKNTIHADTLKVAKKSSFS